MTKPLTLDHLAAICGFLSHGNRRGAALYACEHLGLSSYDALRLVDYGIVPATSNRVKGYEVSP